MFKFIKNAFKNKELCIKFEEIDNLLSTSEKKTQILKILDEILLQKENIKENLPELEKIELDQKVDEKLKNTVKGNIPAFVFAVNQLLDKIQPLAETTPVEIMDFITRTETELESFNKKTYKNFFIMSNLIGKELENIVKNITKINETLKNLKKFYPFLNEEKAIKESIAQIRRYMETDEERKKQIGSYKIEKETILNEIEVNERKMKLLYLSPKLTILKNNRKQLKQIEEELSTLKNILIDFFSIFQKGLKKYNNICRVKLVDDYINNPVEALLNDKGFEVIRHLNEVRKLIEQGKIDIKDIKKNKIVEKISRLEKKDLEEFKKQYYELVNRQKEIEDKIKQSTVEKEILALNDILDERKNRIKDIQNKIGSFKLFDMENEIKEIEEKLKALLNNEVKIECSWSTNTNLKP